MGYVHGAAERRTRLSDFTHTTDNPGGSQGPGKLSTPACSQSLRGHERWFLGISGHRNKQGF